MAGGESRGASIISGLHKVGDSEESRKKFTTLKGQIHQLDL